MKSVPPPGFDPARGDVYALGSTPAASPPPAPPALEPLSRRLLQVAAGLSVLLILVVANAFLHAGGDPLNPIAQAAERTQQSDGARFDLTAVYTSPLLPQPLVATGGGEFNGLTGLSRATLDLAIPGHGTVDFESVADESHEYLRSSAFDGELPAGKQWIGIDPFLIEGEESTLAGSDEAKSGMEMLRAVSDHFEAVGEETLHGTPTHRYRSTIDLGHFADLLRAEGKDEAAEVYDKLDGLMPTPIEVEVWIDGRQIVRQERLVVTYPTEDGKPALKMDMRIELVKLGVTPDIKLPDTSEVFDMTPLLKSHLGLDS